MSTALLMTALIASTPSLGKAAGQCRTPEPGPAFLIEITGLKDRSGLVRAELYPAVEGEFLADDNILVSEGKTFARSDMPVPAAGPVELCIRVPRAGRYALSILHDRNSNLKFDLSEDGIGFPNDPRLGWSKPKAAAASIDAGAKITRIKVRLNYRRGLSMRPLEDK